ncbi:MAG TPA: substrate-binding domain-containing protein [Clostridiales bacterium]|nr:substrate-binding domain-containing protein [Clostridiales bacterium]
MKKRVLAILLMVMVVAGLLAGCGASNKAGNDPADVKKVKIGVILYNYTDIQGKEIKNYCDNYLAKEFPVTFEYQTAASGDNEAHLRAVDALISTGCNAIMSGYDTVIGETMEKCDSAGVYYGILFGEAKNEADKDGKYNSYGNWGTTEQSNLYYSDYFLGGIYQFGSDHGYELGKTYGQAVVDAGVKKVGAISFPAYAFSDAIVICQGFTEVLGQAGVEICPDEKTGGLPAEAGFISVGDDTKAYIAKYTDMDCIFGLSSGMDMVLPAINEVGRLWSPSNTGTGSLKLASLGYNDSSAKYLEDGTLLIGGTNNYVESVAYLFTLMFDAANGYNMKTAEGSGFEYNATINYPTFSNMEELKDMETYMLTTVNNDFTKCSVSAQEIKSVLKAYGGSGAWSELSGLVSRSVAEIKEARQ